MAGYTPLFSDLVTSSVWSEDSDTRVVWITLLAIADSKGQVFASLPGLARLANVSIEACTNAMEKFSQPDKYSRDLRRGRDGRRIETIEGGWLLINFNYYRQKGQKKTAEWWREYRKKSLITKNTNYKLQTTNNKLQTGATNCNSNATVLQQTATQVQQTATQSNVQFDFTNRIWTGITESDLKQWKAAFPSVDIETELKSAAQWAFDNPEKKKKNWRRFLTNWFCRRQEKGGNIYAHSRAKYNRQYADQRSSIGTVIQMPDVQPAKTV